MAIWDFSDAHVESRDWLDEDFFNEQYWRGQYYLSEEPHKTFYGKYCDNCIFCSQTMICREKEYPDNDQAAFLHVVHTCEHCGWWHEIEGDEVYIGDGDYYGSEETRIGILRKFDVGDMDTPITALRRALQMNDALLYELHPRKMEELVTSVFGDFFSCKAIHVGKSGDGGVDVILVESDKDILVQVKRRGTQGRKEGPSVVRELLGTMLVSNSSRGIIVTTANSFTKSAKKTAGKAEKTSVIESIQLVDFARFVDILRLTSEKNLHPWEIYKSRSNSI